MSSQELAAVLLYDSGHVYKAYGWTSTSSRTNGPFTKPGKVIRLGPDGWHCLELFDSKEGSGVLDLKTREEVIAEARDIIESVYDPEASLERTRTFPYNE